MCRKPNCLGGIMHFVCSMFLEWFLLRKRTALVEGQHFCCPTHFWWGLDEEGNRMFYSVFCVLYGLTFREFLFVFSKTLGEILHQKRFRRDRFSGNSVSQSHKRCCAGDWDFSVSFFI